jgi:hypothetical protein
MYTWIERRKANLERLQETMQRAQSDFFSSRASNSWGEKIVIRAAACSIASGRPSSR